MNERMLTLYDVTPKASERLQMDAMAMQLQDAQRQRDFQNEVARMYSEGIPEEVAAAPKSPGMYETDSTTQLGAPTRRQPTMQDLSMLAMQRGMVNEGMKFQQQHAQVEKEQIASLVTLAAINPEAATKAWNSGALGQKWGQISSIGEKGGYEVIKNDSTGDVVLIKKGLRDPREPGGVVQLPGLLGGKDRDKVEVNLNGQTVRVSPDAYLKHMEKKGEGEKLDYESAKKIIQTLPKEQEDAINTAQGLQRVAQMKGLLEKGAGGRGGQIAALVAPVLEMLGIKTQYLTDAQMYQALSQGLKGSLRSSVIGPGPVSNFEQGLLDKVSAGGQTGETAAKELLDYYAQQGRMKLNIYNDIVDEVAKVSPNTGKFYKRIKEDGTFEARTPNKAQSRTAGNDYSVGGSINGKRITRTGNNGTVFQLEDGTVVNRSGQRVR